VALATRWAPITAGRCEVRLRPTACGHDALVAKRFVPFRTTNSTDTSFGGRYRPYSVLTLPTPNHTRLAESHQATLLIAALTRQAAAAVSVGTYWAWETTATLRCARRREALRRQQREERGGGISWRPPAYSLLLVKIVTHCYYTVAVCVIVVILLLNFCIWLVAHVLMCYLFVAVCFLISFLPYYGE